MWFAGNLKLYRKKYKLTQTAVAAALGVRQSNVSDWEKSVTRPARDNLVRLAELFKVTVEQLVGDEGV